MKENEPAFTAAIMIMNPEKLTQSNLPERTLHAMIKGSNDTKGCSFDISNEWEYVDPQIALHAIAESNSEVTTALLSVLQYFRDQNLMYGITGNTEIENVWYSVTIFYLAAPHSIGGAVFCKKEKE